jgi:hypothetical protein
VLVLAGTSSVGASSAGSPPVGSCPPSCSPSSSRRGSGVLQQDEVHALLAAAAAKSDGPAGRHRAGAAQHVACAAGCAACAAERASALDAAGRRAPRKAKQGFKAKLRALLCMGGAGM